MCPKFRQSSHEKKDSHVAGKHGEAREVVNISARQPRKWTLRRGQGFEWEAKIAGAWQPQYLIKMLYRTGNMRVSDRK